MTLFGCYMLLFAGYLAFFKKRGDQAALPPSAEVRLPPEPWASQSPTQWPQIVLTNQASFRQRTPLRGASAFLIEADGRTLGATAQHLLGENGGVQPEAPARELDSLLESWTLHPRTMLDRSVRVAGLGAMPGNDKSYDWLLLRLAPTSAALPATPLHLRAAPVSVGESVHLIGVSYAEPTVTQKVYSGKVTERRYGDRFRYSISPHVDIRGFSGAPIVDDAGLVVGVMTVWFQPKMDGALWTEAGGEDALSALKALRRK
jgi:hypothetical protein